MRALRLTLLLSLFAGICTVSAQMTDEQVINYVQTRKSMGKGEQQIGNELLQRGVTQAQMARLKAHLEQSQGSDEQVAYRSVESQRNERRHNTATDITAGSVDGVAATVDNPEKMNESLAAEHIFGHNIFSGRTLTFEPNENSATPDNYKLGPSDEIIIDIWGSNETSIRQVISPEGSIMISQIGPIYLNGLTVKEANDKIRNIFTRKYAGLSDEEGSSDIRVTLGKIRTIQLNVMGEVVTPGTYRLSGFSTLFHALYNAGGVTPLGSLRNIKVVRGDKVAAVVDVYDYLFKGKLDSDIRLQEGDVIIVPNYTTMANVEGQVKRPMEYELKEGETLADLIEYAGGFTGDAYEEEVRMVRDTGRERKLLTVSKSAFGSTTIEDGDLVTVGAILDRFANRVEIRGSVYRPGLFELGDRTRTVGQLVERAEGLKDDAFTSRIHILREKEDMSLELVAVDLGGILDGSVADVELKRNDVVIVPSIFELSDRGEFAIRGYVARPGDYPYAENTTLEDLILQAGGFLEGASEVNIEVSRRLKDPKSVASESQLSQTFQLSVKDGFIIDGEAGFLLEPYDVVQVRRSPGYQTQRNVVVEGEVIFPGGYTLTQKNERLSDLVKRAGGVTPDAYAHGARLVRTMNEEERAIREATIKMTMRNAGRDSVAMESLDLSLTYTVGIELDKALENPGSDYDMVLREGDRLIIPENISTVRINGNVMYPNTVLYVSGKPVKYYIMQAGGYGYRAKRCKAYVVHMNGTISRARSGKKGTIEPGCEIIVPSKPERNGLRLAEILAIGTTAASIGTMGATISHLVK